ncbi:MAG: hypothetical protein R3E51_00830 [Rhizobiaceae bacterium]
MGRPPVDTEAVTVRMHRSVIDQLDTWRDTATDPYARPEAIRYFVEVGMRQIDPNLDT